MKIALIILIMLAALSVHAHGSTVDVCASNGENPLWNFVNNSGYKNSANVKNVIKEVANRTSESLLSAAVMFGYENQIKRMIKFPEVIEKDGPKALFLAASMGRLSVSSILIRSGVNPNEEIENGLTPIFGAAQYGCVQEMSLLLNAGADVNHKANVNWTLLRLAVGKGNYGAARFIIKNGYIYSESEQLGIKMYLDKLKSPSMYAYIFN